LRLCSLTLLLLITLVALAFTVVESPSNPSWRIRQPSNMEASTSRTTIITVVGFRTCPYYQQTKAMLDYAEQQPRLHGIDKQVRKADSIQFCYCGYLFILWLAHWLFRCLLVLLVSCLVLDLKLLTSYLDVCFILYESRNKLSD
jgi:Flp pilus assembly protein TadB